ncbi:uncharacterized protein LOC134250282 isoform X1 [Saccostrea cucullata]|uniref:uncharacterized protein LOC134250282 isoform X1 n=1 Tax=Saccostrea cuccullata TaxID=36930 RepID=UPI002ED4564F
MFSEVYIMYMCFMAVSVNSLSDNSWKNELVRATNGDNLIRNVLEKLFMEKTKGIELEKMMTKMNSIVGEMKSTIASLKTEMETRKRFRCESGVFGQHDYPSQVTWPHEKNIVFKTAFQEIPTLTYGLYLLDSSMSTNLRVRTDTRKVTRVGFQLSLKPWGNTILYGAKISWMACGR